MTIGLRVTTFVIALTSIATADSRNQVFSDFNIPLPLPADATLVLGIVGGWDRWDNQDRIVPRIAQQIREHGLPGVYVQTVENHKMYLADDLIAKAFPNPQKARLVIYGHSLGGREALRLCRRLDSNGITVILAVLIDAVGREDYSIPSNTRLAANLYQRDSHWPIVGTTQIVAADPEKTQILGNWRYHYEYRFWNGKKIERPEHESGLRWRWMGGHLRMEYDPEVWAKVCQLVSKALTPRPEASVAQDSLP